MKNADAALLKMKIERARAGGFFWGLWVGLIFGVLLIQLLERLP